MEKQVLIEFLSGIVPLPPDAREALREQLRQEPIRAGQLLLKERQVCYRVYFLINGLVHNWHALKGNTYTSRFSGKGEFVFSPISFFNQVPSTENISVIQEGIVLSLSYGQIEILLQQYPQFERLQRVLKQREDLRREKELRTGNHLSARERFQRLTLRFPDIISQAGLKKAASYLHITREALCRIRKKMKAVDMGQLATEIKPVNLMMQEPQTEPTSMHLLFKLLENITSLPQGLKAFHQRNITSVRYHKQAILVNPERVANTVWYLEKGMAKEYYFDNVGKEIVSCFWKENEFILSAESLFGRSLPTCYIELIENSSLLAFSYEHLQETYRNWNEASIITRHIMIADKKKSQLRTELVTLPANEKYKRFCKEFPWHRISSKDICSYLNMAPQTLSHLRGQGDPSKDL